MMQQEAQELRCPFCFQAFSVQSIRFRCINPKCSERTEDGKHASFRDIPPEIKGWVFPPKEPSQSIPLPTRCPSCLMESSMRLCPECHFTLPYDIGQVRQYIVAVVGGTSTGKSMYIASLISALRNQVGQDFHLSVRLLGDETQERWEQDFYKPLFERKIVLQPTRPGGVDSRVKAPLMFRLTFSNGFQKRILNVSIFDTSGEDMASTANMTVHARFIPHADGIILMMDPLQIENVTQQLYNIQIPRQDPRARPEYIFGRITELFGNLNQRQPSFMARIPVQMRSRPAIKKINVPVAFTLSKVDTLTSLLDPSSPLLRPGEHHGSLDFSDLDGIHRETANLLSRYIYPGFCADIDNAFTTYRYFGVSSLGKPPDGHSPIVANPMRVEEPFLWLLQRWGYIKTRRS